MPRKLLNNKNKDLLQVAAILFLLFFYAYHEAEMKKQTSFPVPTAIISPDHSLPTTTVDSHL